MNGTPSIRSPQRWRPLIGAAALLVTLMSLVACGGSTPTDPPPSANSSAGGSSSAADGSSNARGGDTLDASSSGQPTQEAAAPGGDSAMTEAAPALLDAPREATVFTGVAKIMVLGSSNETNTCWRAFLWQKLRADTITSFDFVGGQTIGPDCGVAGYDKDCEARSGTIITGISADTYRGWFAAHPPDVVLMHIGGADLMSNIAVSDVIKTYSVIVEQARSVNPRVIFFAAQHTPQEPTGCADCRADVIALNAAIPGWAMQTTTAQSPVSPVDLFTGMDVVADFSDRVHLNESGSEKVSDRWLAVLRPLFKP